MNPLLLAADRIAQSGSVVITVRELRLATAGEYRTAKEFDQAFLASLDNGELRGFGDEIAEQLQADEYVRDGGVIFASCMVA